MKTFTFVIRRRGGLSGDEAAAICNEAERYDSHVYVALDDVQLSAQSIMGLIALQAACGDEIRIIISGGDEEETETAMKNILTKELG